MSFLKSVGLFIGLGVGIFAGHLAVNMLMGGGRPRRTDETDIVYYDPNTNSYSKTPFPQNQNQPSKHGLDLTGVKFSDNNERNRSF